MYNAGSEPVTLFEIWATVADTIRQTYCNHESRSRLIHSLEEMLRAHESYAWSEYLQQIYTLHQILYATATGSDSKTHRTIKDLLLLFSLTARQFRKDILDKQELDRAVTRRQFLQSTAELMVAEAEDNDDDGIPF